MTMYRPYRPTLHPPSPFAALRGSTSISNGLLQTSLIITTPSVPTQIPRTAAPKLKPPTVLQEFVNHSGVIFKVYVVGKYVKCVKRKSLSDIVEEKLESLHGSLSFSQVSNLTSHDRNDDKYYKRMDLEDAEMSLMSLITNIARGLRKAMKPRLFNFDVIRDTKVGNRYLVIDINYFPGYAKMPGYESVLTDFFWDVLNKK
ncbi:unnamed protein product [Lactuca virosa]|uniref:inositol-1,3,4-trisphosphate 5/6-kinase n=1 Tax=Lactuca virosa TaxID=75947 RepID=A0AAU9LZX0_9ASTR|nr:unnamed protein product [Lactuca virosa]